MTEKLSNLPPQSYFDEQDALALLVPRAKVLAALADAYGPEGAAVPVAHPVDIAINHFPEALAMHSPLAQPVLYVSPEQLAEHSDGYLPARKTPAGKFTQPLYAGAPWLQGRYPHLPQSVGDVTDFGEGKVDIDWGHPAPAGGTRLYSAEQMRAYVDADRAARAEQHTAVAGSNFWSWMRLAYRDPESTQYTVHNMEVAYQAGRNSQQHPALVAGPMPADPTEEMLEVLMAGEDRLRARHGDELPKQRAKERYRALLALAAAPTTHAPAGGTPEDTFQGDTPSLVRNIIALLELDAEGALVPHGVGGHARGLLSAAAARLAAAPQAPAAPALGRSAAQAVQALQEMWDDLEKSGSPRVNARAMRYYSDALSTVEQALLAAPAAPVEPVTPPVIDAKAMKEAFDRATTEGKSFDDALRAAACATIWRRAKRPDGAPDAVGAALVSIAIECALHAEERHSYLPDTPAQAATWRPHDWVLQAMSRAISFDHMMDQAAPAAPAVDASDDKALLDFLWASSCDLRSIDVPTGGDDSDVHWRVIEHYMSEPREREIGRSWSDDPREAIRAAIAAQAKEGVEA